MTKTVPVIVSGGVGSRLWPLSRESHPKPFLRLKDGHSLLQKTCLRALSVPGAVEIVTLTNRELFFYTRDEYAQIGADALPHSYILEPFGRNTAPAIALAAHHVRKRHGDEAILLALPADHVIERHEAFLTAVAKGIRIAAEGALVTFGIRPDAPKTGYGYIETKGDKVLRFIEKPDRDTAIAFLRAGNFFWNAGSFCFSAGSILREMQEHCPDIVKNAALCLENAHIAAGSRWSEHELRAEDFSAFEDISVDYAVFEKSGRVALVPADMGWKDIGSWVDYGAMHPSDEAGNHVHGEAILENVQDSIIHTEGRIVAGMGLKDLVIADTRDALLVAHRDCTQDVGRIVRRLKERAHEACRAFPTVYRPWGSYTVLQEGKGFKIKRIEVKPRASLSLQLHQHRSEHWVVVEGRARVVNGQEEQILHVNESTYIPARNRHRLENPDDKPLTLIEVQCGDYLGEDDIIRIDDVYGRVPLSA